MTFLSLSTPPLFVFDASFIFLYLSHFPMPWKKNDIIFLSISPYASTMLWPAGSRTNLPHTQFFFYFSWCCRTQLLLFFYLISAHLRGSALTGNRVLCSIRKGSGVKMASVEFPKPAFLLNRLYSMWCAQSTHTHSQSGLYYYVWFLTRHSKKKKREALP